nr:MAG TPA: hypothetical protein [Caudoviricetes sp.]
MIHIQFVELLMNKVIKILGSKSYKNSDVAKL